jgi:Protein of unknown function (DUF3987)
MSVQSEAQQDNDNVLKFPFTSTAPQHVKWETPRALPDKLSEVLPFKYEYLPNGVRAWVQDIAERMQCPPDFIGITVMVALASVLGRKIAIHPKEKDNWSEVPNIWGAVIGRPGLLKTPAMLEALKYVRRLQVESDKKHQEVLKQASIEERIQKLRGSGEEKKLKDKFAKDANYQPTKEEREFLGSDLDIEVPIRRRYHVSNITYEKLGVVMAENPTGILVFHDELVSLFTSLEREDFAEARGLYLTSWSGKTFYDFDRIGRGNIHIPFACASLIGSTQPGRMSGYVKKASVGGVCDDGFIQRIQLGIWPDDPIAWKYVDRYPDDKAEEAAWKTFQHLDSGTATTFCAEENEYEPIPYLHFDRRAQHRFIQWLTELERRIGGDEIAPIMINHLSKYRGLVPSLALINFLADGGTLAVDLPSLNRAIAFAEYLESHACRIYGAGMQNTVQTALAIMKRAYAGQIEDGFTSRDITQKDWARLNDPEQVKPALEMLVDYGWLAQAPVYTAGRPKTVYHINPVTFE